MHLERAEEIFTASKSTSVKSEGERADALAENRAEQDLIRERMAIQRTNRLSATSAVMVKNGA